MTKALTSTLKKKKKGFTLIELIIVIAIIAIIAAIAIPNFAKVRNDAKLKADNQSCETIKKTTLTKIADGSISVLTTAQTFNITFDTDGKAVFTGATALGTVLDTIKKPQQDSATEYIVTINSVGEVQVKTDKSAKTDAITTP